MQIRLAGWISTTEFFLVLRMSSLYEDFEDENLHPYSKADRFVAALMLQQPESNEKELRKLKEIELKQRVLQNRLRESGDSSGTNVGVEELERKAAKKGIYLHQDLEDIDLDHQTEKQQGTVAIDWPEFLVIVARLRTTKLLVRRD